MPPDFPISEKLQAPFEGLFRFMGILLLVSVAVYVVFAPTIGFSSSYVWHDEQRIGEILILSVAVVSLLSPTLAKRTSRQFLQLPQKSRLLLFGVFSLGLLSSLLASVPRMALLEWSSILLLVAFGFVVAAIRTECGPVFDRAALMVLIASTCLYAARVLVGYSASMLEHVPLLVWELFDGFSNIRFFGHFQSMTLPLLVIPAMIWARSPLQKLLLASLPSIWWTLAVASGTRGTWLGMASAMLILPIALGCDTWRWLKWQFLTLVVGIALYLILFVWVPSALEVRAHVIDRLPDLTSLSLRGELWKDCFKFIRSHPLLGIGPMHFAYHQNPIAAHPHNALLQIMTEWGLPAGLMFAALGVTGLVGCLRSVRQSDTSVESRLFRIALAASIIALSAQSMVDGVVVMPFSQVIAALACGWMLGSWVPTRLGRADVKNRYTIGSFAVAPLLVLAVFINGVYPEILSLPEREAIFLKAHPQMPKPRFWNQGWIPGTP